MAKLDIVEQRDYFMKYIDAMGKALAALFSNLLSSGNTGRGTPKMEMVDAVLKQDLKLDLDALLTMDNDKVIEYLKNDIALKEENFDVLAEVLLNIADESTQVKECYQKALILLEYSSKKSESYNLTLEDKIKMIKEHIL